MVHSFTECTISTEHGQFILYKNIQDSWKMCTADKQNSKKNALMFKSQCVRSGKIQFALRFKRGQLYYSPAVTQGKLEMKETTSSPDDDYWFEKVNMGADKYHALRAVSKPQSKPQSSQDVYLCVEGSNISTCLDPLKGLKVRVEKID